MHVSLLAVPLAVLQVSMLPLPPRKHVGLLRGLNVAHQIQKRVPVPSAQCRQSFCVALTRDHHVRHLHQCPEVVSLTRQATTCLVPSEEELVLCIQESANLCDIEYPDTSYTQVFANRLQS